MNVWVQSQSNASWEWAQTFSANLHGDSMPYWILFSAKSQRGNKRASWSPGSFARLHWFPSPQCGPNDSKDTATQFWNRRRWLLNNGDCWKSPPESWKPVSSPASDTQRLGTFWQFSRAFNDFFRQIWCQIQSSNEICTCRSLEVEFG
jgi:hypothetical protein